LGHTGTLRRRRQDRRAIDPLWLEGDVEDALSVIGEPRCCHCCCGDPNLEREPLRQVAAHHARIGAPMISAAFLPLVVVLVLEFLGADHDRVITAGRAVGRRGPAGRLPAWRARLGPVFAHVRDPGDDHSASPRKGLAHTLTPAWRSGNHAASTIVRPRTRPTASFVLRRPYVRKLHPDLEVLNEFGDDTRSSSPSHSVTIPALETRFPKARGGSYDRANMRSSPSGRSSKAEQRVQSIGSIVPPRGHAELRDRRIPAAS